MQITNVLHIPTYIHIPFTVSYFIVWNRGNPRQGVLNEVHRWHIVPTASAIHTSYLLVKQIHFWTVFHMHIYIHTYIHTYSIYTVHTYSAYIYTCYTNTNLIMLLSNPCHGIAAAKIPPLYVSICTVFMYLFMYVYSIESRSIGVLVRLDRVVFPGRMDN